MVISLYPLPFFVWVWIAVRGRRRNLAQGAGSPKTGNAYIYYKCESEFDVCDPFTRKLFNQSSCNFIHIFLRVWSWTKHTFKKESYIDEKISHLLTLLQSSVALLNVLYMTSILFLTITFLNCHFKQYVSLTIIYELHSQLLASCASYGTDSHNNYVVPKSG